MASISISDLSSGTKIKVSDLISKKDAPNEIKVNGKLKIEKQEGKIVIKSRNQEFEYRSSTWAQKKLDRLIIIYELRGD